MCSQHSLEGLIKTLTWSGDCRERKRSTHDQAKDLLVLMMTAFLQGEGSRPRGSESQRWDVIVINDSLIYA